MIYICSCSAIVMSHDIFVDMSVNNKLQSQSVFGVTVGGGLGFINKQ